MPAISGVIFCSAFILGLLFTGFSGTVRGIPIGSIVLLLTGVLLSFLIPRFWRIGIKSWVWVIAGVIAFLAGLYFQWRLPQPDAMDVSHWVENLPTPHIVEVTGKIATSPRLTQSQRIQFELQATQVKKGAESEIAAPEVAEPEKSAIEQPASTTGKVYVTVPLLQGTGLYPGQTITVTGSLYLPKPAANPGGFDFAHYLAHRGIFSGLNGRRIDRTQNRASSPLLWSIRQRMIRAHVKGAGVPEGLLLSAMVMGGRSVDVPHAVRDSFRVAGLSHMLAASGAHVAILLGVVMALTRRCTVKWQVVWGVGALLLFLGLAGFQPSVGRAVIMGSAALLGRLIERKIKPLGALLVTATLLLVITPVWVWDIGFQLSFLATLGLLVTVPVLSNWLDWLPKLLIPWFAVPIAAYLWTLPILLHTFGVVSIFSILINILASPLFTIVSLGGMVSGLAALVHPEAGQIAASWLYYPAHSLIGLAEWGSQLPGSSLAVGTISVAQLVMLYGLMVGVWQWNRSHRFWWVAAVVGISLVAVPVGYGAMTRFQVTVLATSGDPVMVVQNQGTVALINGGKEADARFTILPFLQSQGINQIDQAIALSQSTEAASWQRIAMSLPIYRVYAPAEPPSAIPVSTETVDRPSSNTPSFHAQQHYAEQPYSNLSTITNITNITPFLPQQSIAIGSTTVNLIHSHPTVMTMKMDQKMGEQTWLLLEGVAAMEESAALAKLLPPAQVLWWSGEPLSPEILEAVQPKIAIANARSLPPQTQNWLQTHHTATYLTGRDGAVQWTPATGFRAMVPSLDAAP
jgi:competence protein ComEC